jgi:hypothetical protein
LKAHFSTADNGADPADASDLLSELHDGAWLDAQKFPPLEYHVPMLIPEGSVLLVGAPKIGKSWLVLSIALGVAYGGVVLGGIHVDGRPVLYLALEDGHRRLQDRCRTLLQGARIPKRLDCLTRIEPGTVLATVELWLTQHAGQRPLVILDTLGKVMPPAQLGESAYQRDYRIGSALKRTIDGHPGASLVVNHHDRKAASEDFIDSVSGTHGLAGAADTIIVLTRDRFGRDALVRVTGRDVAEGEYALGFEAGSRWVLDGDSFDRSSALALERRTADRLGDQSNAILAFVNEHTDGVSTATVKDAFGSDALRYLDRLYKAGRLRRPKRGVYAPAFKTNGHTDTSDTPLGGQDSVGPS